MKNFGNRIQKVYQKLQQEFYGLKRFPKKSLSNFEAIIVFSAEEVTVTGESRERILQGVNLMKKIKDNGIFIYLGTKTHNHYSKAFLNKKNFKLPVFFPCTRKHTSTRTQIIDLAKFLKKKHLSNLLIVSHSYHIPRIAGYCQKYLSESAEYDFLGIGEIKKQQKQVEKEIEKIIKYSAKGDLPAL